MRFSESARRRVSLLAMFVFLFALLVPVLASAAGGERSRTIWLEICGPKGAAPMAVTFTTDESEGEPKPALHQGHCLLCFAPAAGIGPVGIQPFAPAAADSLVPVGDVVVPPASRGWRPSLARAPPLMS